MTHSLLSSCTFPSHRSQPLSSLACCFAVVPHLFIHRHNGLPHTAYTGLPHTVYGGLPHTVFVGKDKHLRRYMQETCGECWFMPFRKKSHALYCLKSHQFVIPQSEGTMVHIYIIFILRLVEVSFAWMRLSNGVSVVAEQIHVVV